MENVHEGGIHNHYAIATDMYPGSDTYPRDSGPTLCPIVDYIIENVILSIIDKRCILHHTNNSTYSA